MAEEPLPGDRLVRGVGLGVMAVCALVCLSGVYAGVVIVKGPRGLEIAAAMLPAAASCALMLIDGYDLWFRGRTFSENRVALIHLGVVLGFIVGSVFAFVAKLHPVALLIPAPAFLVYLFTVKRPPRPAAHGGSASAARAKGSKVSGAARGNGKAPNGKAAVRSAASPGAAASSRQRRGGKKRR